MPKVMKLYCHAFRKNADGSWDSIISTDIQDEVGAIRIPPGMTFLTGKLFCGIDVVAALEQTCPQ